ncbi:RNA polymerase sigma factor [Acidiluteibacter ferrifornacis]|jgi:RNA polymerase sigma factor (sigma-70 family)|uniref:Sigma-70 family RNA polymerase sigma factor n=1 Tax=Acidiluteibacter ferrifornacis TaxID=2692424 RepID=A0A6N9NH65_9FLAO|nr:RNA polymerase sigma factor [Acidiluteibacter ferrifornacis]MBR9830858.1 RNA polymerase sigma factor [bacterium]NBG64881.1 sigma-70 family RNA polymerase sigma factor [Acidiluteibacter ferrifornacis]|tara:strand:+ start:157 stop:642 length:486 start_codon:yes stop_codon:yes gene_type:complete
MNKSQYNESVSLYSDNIYRFILKNIKDADKAKDIVQETYVKLWDKLDSVDFLKVKSYLFTTAYHTLIDMVRRDKRQTSFGEVDYNEHAHSEGYSDLKEILDEAISKLPEIQRSVILLRDYEGYSYQEIGEILSLSESQVKVYIFRSRKFLKNYLVSVENLL